MKNTKASTITFCDLLGLLFIALKLCGVISWAWVWVLSPIWIPVVIALILCAIILITRLF